MAAKSATWIGLLAAAAAWAQAPGSPQAAASQPVYRVTVVSRTLQAINYEHLNGPTMIDLSGTALLPGAKGSAMVESKRGRTTIDARIDHLEAPTRYGAEYLTYVLWAITPDGRAKNLGEVLAGSSDKSHIRVTTDLQAFGLIITAEPYYSVSAPSDAVVVQNVVRPDTIGMRELVSARYDVLQRGPALNLQLASSADASPQGKKVPYDQYEAVLQLYQAENAVQFANAAGAQRLAPEAFQHATALLDKARQIDRQNQDRDMVISLAREATQAAEDARVMAMNQRAQEQQQESARLEEQSRIRAQERSAEQARAQAEAARQQLQARPAEETRQEEEHANDGEAAAQASEPPPPVVGQVVPRAKFELTGNQRRNRAELLEQLAVMLDTLDTPRGLVAKLPDPLFVSGTSATLRPAAAERLMRIGNILRTRPGLVLRVESFTDSSGNGEICRRRADVVRETLIRYGVAPDLIAAQSFGNSRPVASNATASGRAQNRRVEIVIGGPAIGNMALWDRAYTLGR